MATDSYELLVTDLILSQQAPLIVGAMHLANGVNDVEFTQPYIPAPGERYQDWHGDSADLLIQRQPTEAKHRRELTFTTKEKWPHHLRPPIIDLASKLRTNRPRYVYLCNGPLTYALVLDTTRTERQWTYQNIVDARIGRERSYALCPLEYWECVYINYPVYVVPRWELESGPACSKLARSAKSGIQSMLDVQEPWDAETLQPLFATLRQRGYHIRLRHYDIDSWQLMTRERTIPKEVP